MAVIPVLKGSVPLLASGHPLVNTRPDWKDLVAWTHCWDLASQDTVLYTPSAGDITNYPLIDSSPRVSSVADNGSATHKALRRDQGFWSTTYSLSAFVPGPLYTATSTRYPGRPHATMDHVFGSGMLQYAGLSPNDDPTDTAKWFNPTAGFTGPYWYAILGTGSDCQQGSVQAGPTITRLSVGCYDFGLSPTTYLISLSAGYDYKQPVLLQYYNSGNGRTGSPPPSDSWLEVTFKYANGSLATTRVLGGQDNFPWGEMFMGFVGDQGAWTCSGIKTGTPAESDVTKVRSWASEFMGTPPL